MDQASQDLTEAALRRWLEAAVTAAYAPMQLTALEVLGDWEEARDATQTAVLQATRFILGLLHLPPAERRRRLPAKPRAWLRRVALNAALDRRRGRQRQSNSGGELGHFLLADAGEGPEDQAARADALRRASAVLPRLIDRLPSQQAQTMRLVWTSGAWPPDYELLCARLGIARSAARKRVHDALRNLRAMAVRVGLDQEVSP